MRDEPTLSPCPFCGSAVDWCNCGADGGCHLIECSTCMLQIDTLDPRTHNDDCDTIEKLREISAAAWNTRATNQ